MALITPWYEFPQVSRILDRLYIGTLPYARTLLTSNEFGIETVINCTCENFNKDGRHDPTGKLEVVQIPIDDGEAIPEKELRRAMVAIWVNLSKGKTVLVNCHAGISRSVTITASYLYCAGMDFDEAIAFIKRKRSVADPHAALTSSVRRIFGLTPEESYENQTSSD